MSDKDSLDNQEYLDHGRLKSRTKMALNDVSGRGDDILFEINWNGKVRNKGFIKISIGDMEAVVSREQLWAIMFMFGSAAEQEKLISPFVKQTQVLKFFRIVGVTAQKDIRKGEMLNVPLEFTLNPDSKTVTIGKGNMGAFRKDVRSFQS